MENTAADALIDGALVHHRAGRRAEAEQGYRRALDVSPGHPDALHLLGLLWHEQRDYGRAVPQLRAAVAADPRAAEFHYGLAEALRLSGQARDAVESYGRAVALDPSLVDAWRGLGASCQLAGQPAAAANAFARAAAMDPRHAETCNNLGLALRHVGRAGEAIGWLRKAIALRPGFVEAHENLLRTLMDVEDWSGAVAAAERFVAETPDRASSLVALASAMLNADRVADAAATARRAVELEPGGAGGHLVLGTALERGNDYRGASEAYARCADLRPTEPELRVRLAVALSRQGRLGEAAEQFRRATELVPRDSRVKANLAGVLGEMGRLKEAATIAEENAAAHPTDPGALTQAAILLNRLGESSRAETYYRRAIEAAPDDGSCAGNYAALLVQTARLPEALGLYRLALAAEPGLPTIHSGMLLFMNADPATSPNELFAEHVKWAQVHAGHLPAPPPHANEPSPYRRLRIGYLSQDWRGHSVAFFMEPLLSAHDRKNYEIVVYDDVTAPDQITLHLAGHVDYWNRVVGLDHEKLAGRIREDRIDVLVDLAGHTGNNRLLTLARKPAPVQVTYLGYPNTTGLTAVDYRITDAIADPPGVTDRYYTERLVRLPRLFLSFRPPGGSPDVTDRPSDSDGRIRFAAFNAPWKLHPGVIEAWCRVLRAVPGSRLLMKGSGLGDRATRQRFLDLFESFGVSADRVEVVAWTPTYAAHMGLYNRCDIALDTFPYNGTTTTCEALWMGVPVVTFEGAVHAGRVGATLLRSVGLQGLVAEDVEGYVRAAARLATDRSELDRIRRGLRERMRMSPLMDANGLARAVEGAYRRMWWDWCARRS